MVRPDQVGGSRERKLNELADFASELSKTLPNTASSRHNELIIAEIKTHTANATALASDDPQPALRPLAKEIEEHGRSLWNLCIRIKHGNTEADPKVLLLTRAFSFGLLCLGRGARRQKKDAEPELVYLMTSALTLARLCMNEQELALATDTLHKAAELLDRLKSITSELPVEKGRVRLEADYHALRIALAWRDDRLDVAEHMFSKTESLVPLLDVSSAEIMADTLKEIGNDLLSKSNYELAIKWLKRGYDIVDSQALDRMSADGLENRLAICHGLVQTHLKIGTTDSLHEAENMVAYVEAQMGDTPLVLHWRLEILQNTPGEMVDADKYSCILRRMVRTFGSSDQEFRSLLYHIKELRTINSRLAIALIDELLNPHILESNNREWLNKALVTRIGMTTMEPDSTDRQRDLEMLNELLDTISDAVSEPLCPDAAGAVHSLIWKKLNAVITSKRFDDADSWCITALHELFCNSGPENLAKFGRKQILCALNLADAPRARAVFKRLPHAAQNDHLTHFLMFRVSLLDWDHQLGSHHIEFLGRPTEDGENQEMLYACIREATAVQDEICSLSALKAAVENWSPMKEPSGSLPLMIRCFIRLINRVEENERVSKGEPPTQSSIDDMCAMFERAADFARRMPQDKNGKTIFTVPELTWFRKNAYNIGARYIGVWRVPSLVRIFTACLNFIACFPTDIPTTDGEELGLMALRCHFIAAAAHVSEARTTDQVAEQAERYLEVRQHAAAFDDRLSTEAGIKDKHIIQDLHAKSATMLVFDFEAVVALQDWDDLSPIVRRARMCREEVALKAMGDCLLRSQAPGNVMFSTMRLIIDEIFELERFDNEKLAKYIRCIYQVILPLNDDNALRLLDEALRLAREGAEVGRAFPSAELEWTVATSFNHAVDFYARNEEEKCHKWALKSMDLATFMDDGGSYRNMLQEKFSHLRFNVGRTGWRCIE